MEDGTIAGGTVNVSTGPSDSQWGIIAAAFKSKITTILTDVIFDSSNQ